MAPRKPKFEIPSRDEFTADQLLRLKKGMIYLLAHDTEFVSLVQKLLSIKIIKTQGMKKALEKLTREEIIDRVLSCVPIQYKGRRVAYKAEDLYDAFPEMSRNEVNYVLNYYKFMYKKGILRNDLYGRKVRFHIIDLYNEMPKVEPEGEVAQ